VFNVCQELKMDPETNQSSAPAHLRHEAIERRDSGESIRSIASTYNVNPSNYGMNTTITAPHRYMRLLRGFRPAAMLLWAVALALMLATQINYTYLTIIVILAALGTVSMGAAYVNGGEAVPAEITSPVKSTILGFERRARIQQCESYLLLLVMLLLLSAAAWVFTNARAITTQDTGGRNSQA
jgi:hypothetical protein